MRALALRSLRSPLLVAVLVLFGAQDVLAEKDAEERNAEREKAARPELGGDDAHRDEHARLLKTGEENLAEINRLLEEIQKNLSEKETGAATQAKQAAAVEKMEGLIKEMGKG
jgi:hypothetical protein